MLFNPWTKEINVIKYVDNGELIPASKYSKTLTTSIAF